MSAFPPSRRSFHRSQLAAPTNAWPDYPAPLPHQSINNENSEFAPINRQTVVRQIEPVPDAEAARRSAVGTKLNKIADKPHAAVGQGDVGTSIVQAANCLLPVGPI